MGLQFSSLQSVTQLLNSGNLSPRLAKACFEKNSANTTEVSGIFMATYETRTRGACLRRYEGRLCSHANPLSAAISWLTILLLETRVTIYFPNAYLYPASTVTLRIYLLLSTLLVLFMLGINNTVAGILDLSVHRVQQQRHENGFDVFPKTVLELVLNLVRG